MSDIWKYFDKLSNEEARCKICNKKLKPSLGSTKGLWKHLESMHSKEFKVLKSSENACEKNSAIARNVNF